MTGDHALRLLAAPLGELWALVPPHVAACALPAEVMGRGLEFLIEAAPPEELADGATRVTLADVDGVYTTSATVRPLADQAPRSLLLVCLWSLHVGAKGARAAGHFRGFYPVKNFGPVVREIPISPEVAMRWREAEISADLAGDPRPGAPAGHYRDCPEMILLTAGGAAAGVFPDGARLWHEDLEELLEELLLFPGELPITRLCVHPDRLGSPWWAAAAQALGSCPPAARALIAAPGLGGLYIPRDELAPFLQWAAGIPGWHTAPIFLREEASI